MGDWANFALVVGGASGALTGLLFVAVSLNRDRILEHARLRTSAAQTVVLFILPLVVAIVLLTPDQGEHATGAELVATALGFGAVLARMGLRDRTAEVDPSFADLARQFDRSTPALLTVLLTLTAGITGILGVGGGRYYLVPAVLFALVGGVRNAWLFLVRLPV